MSGTYTGDIKGVSEADVLQDTLNRARGKGVGETGNREAAKITKRDTLARTTFDNMIQAINKLDRDHGGYWNGDWSKFAVLSAKFHGPRIAEMFKAFGLSGARVLSAEDILTHYGYSGPDSRLYP